MFDYSKLRGRIREKFGSETNFARELGINKNTLSRKFNSKGGLAQSTMIKWAELLEISANDFGEYFFKLKEEK